LLGYAFSHQTNGGWLPTQNLRYASIDIDHPHIHAMDVLACGVTRASRARPRAAPPGVPAWGAVIV
jgi:iron complex outermembrane receptor protein